MRKDGRRAGPRRVWAGGALLAAAVITLLAGLWTIPRPSPAAPPTEPAVSTPAPDASARAATRPHAGSAAHTGPPARTGADTADYRRVHPAVPRDCAATRRRPEPHDLVPSCSYPVVGVFEWPGGRRTCTAAVVDSGNGDLLVTAAHCLPLDGAVFVPGHHDGVAPLGRWPVVAALADPRFTTARQGAEHWPYDWAFVRVARVGGKSVQEAVGSAFHVPPHPEELPADLDRVTLIGHPHNRPGQHVCTVDSAPAYGAFRQARCAGFSSGVSGSPWVISAQEGDGIVVGVLGGAEHGGGFLSDVSYTARFDAGVTALFEQAQGVGTQSAHPAP
ncbi:trypsin-like serine peptidase [Streptomyces sp. NPDC006711]|uniref:trypsin-like serine peptidase n=1 Tax=Streptomyces sp. NPDC006711 TaxID=3364762 RepID=UPI0036852969